MVTIIMASGHGTPLLHIIYMYTHRQAHERIHTHTHRMLVIIQFKILLPFHPHSKNQNYEICVIVHVKLSTYTGDSRTACKTSWLH